ncbi:MAG: type II toxin-antitoxin system RelE/ParE family toxin [Chitinophagales bacterium]|nr:type II toxin-antitoxin system RelE/ParE family toxin [Chitinophagales bacterium]
MDYKIIWSQFSEIEIDNIYDYYKNKANSKLASKIVKNILVAPNILIKNTKIGVPELNLKDREIEYRYIVSTNYKIIYSINDADKTIRIADVFDTRQNPARIEKRIK